MVPSDPRRNPAPGQHAWCRALRRERNWRSPRYTRRCFFGSRGLDWGGPLPVSPVRSRHLRAVFHWPMTMVAGQPSWGLCSRPAFSTSRWIVLKVRSARNSSLIRFASASAISTPRARCPDFSPSIPVSPRISASPSGLASLSGSALSLRFAIGKLTFRNCPIPSCSPS